ncbi:hypothetical protein GCM10029992_10390 [Glycomyces albus]
MARMPRPYCLAGHHGIVVGGPFRLVSGDSSHASWFAADRLDRRGGRGDPMPELVRRSEIDWLRVCFRVPLFEVFDT